MGVTVLNQTGLPIRVSSIRAFVKVALEELEVGGSSLSVVLVEEETIRDYNKRFRGVDAPTDVMAFFGEGDYLGDIIICPFVVFENAQELSRDKEEEFYFVLAHGILHLLGYTDKTQEERMEMFRLQDGLLESVRAKLTLLPPLFRS